MSDADDRGVDLRLFALLLVFAFVGTLCANVEMRSHLASRKDALFVLGVVSVTIGITLFAVGVGLAMAKSTGLGAFDLRACIAREPNAGRNLIRASLVVSAVVTAIELVVVGLFWWRDPKGSKLLALELSNHPLWERLVKCLGAGIQEEILFRLGLMSLVIWLIGVFSGGRARPWKTWVGIVVASIAFAVMHVPALWLHPISNGALLPTLKASQTRLLVTFASGLVLGWIYWRKGLAPAFLAHASADIALVILGPAMLS